MHYRKYRPNESPRARLRNIPWPVTDSDLTGIPSPPIKPPRPLFRPLVEIFTLSFQESAAQSANVAEGQLFERYRNVVLEDAAQLALNTRYGRLGSKVISVTCSDAGLLLADTYLEDTTTVVRGYHDPCLVLNESASMGIALSTSQAFPELHVIELARQRITTRGVCSQTVVDVADQSRQTTSLMANYLLDTEVVNVTDQARLDLALSAGILSGPVSLPVTDGALLSAALQGNFQFVSLRVSDDATLLLTVDGQTAPVLALEDTASMTLTMAGQTVPILTLTETVNQSTLTQGQTVPILNLADQSLLAADGGLGVYAEGLVPLVSVEVTDQAVEQLDQGESTYTETSGSTTADVSDKAAMLINYSGLYNTLAETPYDQAVYHPTRDMIYAVRGGTLYELSATTGLEQRSLRYEDTGDGLATLCYNPILDQIVASCWNNPALSTYFMYDVDNPDQQRHIRFINPTTMTVASSFLFSEKNTYLNSALGIWNLRYNNGKIYATGCNSYNTVNLRLFWLDAANPTTATYRVTYSPYGSGQGDMAPDLHDPGTGVRDWIWVADQQLGDVYAVGMTPAGGSLKINYIANEGPKGVATDPAGQVWVSYGNSRIRRYDSSGRELMTWLTMPNQPVALAATIDTGRPDFRCLRVRYNPNDGKVYAPGYHDNSVAVIDPADNSFVLKEGFDLPMDVVFTPTKKWAVQRGRHGLQEII